MVAIDTLKYLSAQKEKDASVLFQQGRKSGAIYLIGYAVELALKRKVSLTLGFNHGFPETPSEFAGYSTQITAFNAIGTGIQLNKLKEIRNHNLNLLLTYSGASYTITTSFYAEWNEISSWNPEDRYKVRRYTQLKAEEFMNSAKTILKQIL